MLLPLGLHSFIQILMTALSASYLVMSCSELPFLSQLDCFLAMLPWASHLTFSGALFEPPDWPRCSLWRVFSTYTCIDNHDYPMILYFPPGCESLTSKITGQVSCNQIVSLSPGPTIPEILMTQANLTQTPFLQMGKLVPQRHRDLPKVMNQLQGFSLCPPQVLLPAYSPATSPSLGEGSGTESRPVPGLTCCCPMGFRGEAARCLDSFTSLLAAEH